MDETLSIESLNVRGMRDSRSLPKIRTVCYRASVSESDITVLIDTHLDKSTENNVRQFWNNEIIFSHNKDKHTNGIVILLKPHIKVQKVFSCKNGRTIIIRTEINNIPFLIVAIYAPAKNAKEKSNFFNDTLNLIQAHKRPEDQLMIVGDFNMVENPKLDRYPSERTNPSAKTLHKVTSELELFDAWRETNPDRIEYTFLSDKGKSRLDRIYITNTLKPNISSIQHEYSPFSDHKYIRLTLSFTKKKFGKGLWSFNTRLLEKEEYQRFFTNMWTLWQEQKHLYNIKH